MPTLLSFLSVTVALIASAPGVVLPPSDDATTSGKAKAAVPSAPTVQVSDKVRGWIQFNLNQLPTGTTGAQIARATLRLYPSVLSKDSAFSVSLALGAWNEKTLTEATAPAVGLPEIIGVPMVKGAKGSFLPLDVTEVVQGWIDHPETNHGFVLTGVENSPVIGFDSKENTAAGHYPQLEITLIPTVANGTVTNLQLQNPSITVTPGVGLSGGGVVSLGGTVTLGSNATSANTPGTLVMRDAEGAFSATRITASLDGNAATASVAADALKLAGVAASEFALRNDTAPDALKLGGVSANLYAKKTDLANLDGASLAQGSVTADKLAPSATLPAGGVIAFAGTNAPPGWLVCDGSVVSRAAYPALFSAIGTAHGSGDGATTFNLPDYRGRFLRGVDGGPVINDPDRAGRTPMAPGGNTGWAVGTVQGDELKAHSHSYSSNGNSDYSRGGAGTFSGEDWSSPNNAKGRTSGASGGLETRPKNVYVNYLIKY